MVLLGRFWLRDFPRPSHGPNCADIHRQYPFCTIYLRHTVTLGFDLAVVPFVGLPFIKSLPEFFFGLIFGFARLLRYLGFRGFDLSRLFVVVENWFWGSWNPHVIHAAKWTSFPTREPLSWIFSGEQRVPFSRRARPWDLELGSKCALSVNTT